jgi:hypothetical protein
MFFQIIKFKSSSILIFQIRIQLNQMLKNEMLKEIVKKI